MILKGKSVASRERKVKLQCYVSEFPTIPIVEPPPSLSKYHFGNVGAYESRSLAGKIMVGAEYFSLFPERTSLPCLDNDDCQGLVGFVSKITGQWLIAGEVGNPGKSHPVSIVTNMMTIPKAKGRGEGGARRRSGRQGSVMEEIISGVGTSEASA